MLKTRTIPVLLLREGRMVKGQKFCQFRDTGDPVSAARIYNAQNADELAFIDIEATNKGRSALVQIIEAVSSECFMPLLVGGGVQSVDDVRSLLCAGADKVLINSAAIEVPGLIREATRIFGSQCVVVGIDVRRHRGGYQVWTHCGTKLSNTDLVAHIKRMQVEGAGELIINSIDEDGMMNGYDLTLLKLVRQHTGIPIIAMGGAGNFQHLAEAIAANVHAVACASLFHFGDNNPIRARAFLKNNGIAVKVV